MKFDFKVNDDLEIEPYSKLVCQLAIQFAQNTIPLKAILGAISYITYREGFKLSKKFAENFEMLYSIFSSTNISFGTAYQVLQMYSEILYQLYYIQSQILYKLSTALMLKNAIEKGNLSKLGMLNIPNLPPIQTVEDAKVALEALKGEIISLFNAYKFYVYLAGNLLNYLNAMKAIKEKQMPPGGAKNIYKIKLLFEDEKQGPYVPLLLLEITIGFKLDIATLVTPGQPANPEAVVVNFKFNGLVLKESELEELIKEEEKKFVEFMEKVLNFPLARAKKQIKDLFGEELKEIESIKWLFSEEELKELKNEKKKEETKKESEKKENDKANPLNTKIPMIEAFYGLYLMGKSLLYFFIPPKPKEVKKEKKEEKKEEKDDKEKWKKAKEKATDLAVNMYELLKDYLGLPTLS